MEAKAKNTEELRMFVERFRHFMNLWTVYKDTLTKHYVPTVGADAVDEPMDGLYFHPSTTIMLVLYAYFYSLIDGRDNRLNAFRIWREHFPEEEPAIDLRLYRNRLGFHGSRTRAHEASGWDLFANTSGSAIWDAIKNFKALAATLLAKDMAIRHPDQAEIAKYRGRIDAIAERARQATAALSVPATAGN